MDLLIEACRAEKTVPLLCNYFLAKFMPGTAKTKIIVISRKCDMNVFIKGRNLTSHFSRQLCLILAVLVKYRVLWFWLSFSSVASHKAHSIKQTNPRIYLTGTITQWEVNRGITPEAQLLILICNLYNFSKDMTNSRQFLRYPLSEKLVKQAENCCS